MQKLVPLVLLYSLATLSIPAQGAPPTVPITALVVSPESTFLLVGSQTGIEVRSLAVPGNVTLLPTRLEHVHDLCFSPNGKSLLAAGGSPAEFGAVEVWDWPSRSRSMTVKSHEDVVYSVAWTSDGSQWASAGWDGVACVFDAEADRPRIVYQGHSRPLLAIDFYPDASSLVSGGIEGTIQLWQAIDGALTRSLRNHVNIINDLSFSPKVTLDSPPMLASISEDHTVRLWQPNNGRLVRFAKLTTKPKCLVWQNDGLGLVVGCEDGTVRWLDAATLAEQRREQVFDHAILSITQSPLDQTTFVGSAKGGIKPIEKAAQLTR